MKLLYVHIENFRLLTDVKLKFSTDKEKNITVIRAANESGKTTLLMALQWGLFGDGALPNNGRDFRMSHLNVSQSEKIERRISVSIDFEVPSRTGKKVYRLIRTTNENVDQGSWERSSAKLTLYKLTSRGGDLVLNPDSHIRPYLPNELREVFFTDGDRALSFIEGSRGQQMKRVEGAIRSLLGLEVIEDAVGHITKVCGVLNKKAKKNSKSVEKLQDITQIISDLEEQIPKLENDLNECIQSRIKLEDLEQEADKKLIDSLRKGDRSDIENEFNEVKMGIKLAEKEFKLALREHTNLFKSNKLAKQLLEKKFAVAKIMLDTLHDAGRIPNQTIPVLEDILNHSTCICGESLNPKDSNGLKRREQIKKLIEDSRNSDAIQKIITGLYYNAKDLLTPIDGPTWADDYKQVYIRREQASEKIQYFGELYREVEAKLEKLPDVDIQQLRITRNKYREDAREKQGDEWKIKNHLEMLRDNYKDAEIERKNLLQKDEKGSKINTEFEVAEVLKNVFESSLEIMKTQELKKVSQMMNDLFLTMIGADPEEQRSVISRATITPDFRIVVHGSQDQPLDPSQDLNGASRRALTIAFILALTRVSEVEAPNVIDTPLGMMSGYVKQAVLQLASAKSTQLILFLTHSEIAGCEDILDKYAGEVFTLSNPAHYPTILVNDPGTVDGVQVCGCNHRVSCQLCQRKEEFEISR